MRETPRVTRGWPFGVPKYTTSYKQPFDWRFFSVPALAPMFLTFLFLRDSGAFDAVFIVSFVWCFGWMVHRRTVRERWCADHGHDPFRPVPEVDQYRCRHCDSLLGDDEVVDQAERGVIPRPQSYYSDRR